MSDFFEYVKREFEKTLPFLPGSGDPILRKIRKQALSDAIKLQLPNRKQALWKYSELDFLRTSRIKLQKRKLSSFDLKDIEKIEKYKKNENPTFVFVNGFFASSLSTNIKNLPFSMKFFRGLCKAKDPIIEDLLSVSSLSNDIFKKLNSALVNDGGLLIIPETYEDETPIIIHHYLIDHEDNHYWVFPHIHIHLEKNSKAKIIEKTTCFSSTESYINTQTFLKLSSGSKCDYLRIDKGNSSSYTFSYVATLQGSNSELNLRACTQNGRYHRMEIKNELCEKKAYYSFQGLILAKKFSHHDWVTQLHHLKSNSESIQSVKSIVANEGHASYLGNILVNPGATKTLANMENFHLLLGPHGRAESSPQLQILCDDLKCNHRSSTTQLDEAILFYLISRGIEQKEASRILLYAYLENFIASLSDLKTQFIAKKSIEKSILDFQEENEQ